MQSTGRRSWLVAYDIADPRRLARVHAYLKRRAIPVQYSVFVLHGGETLLERVLRGIGELIELADDDVRAYHLPDRCEIAMLGIQSLPEGVIVASSGLARLLQELPAGYSAAAEADEPFMEGDDAR
jgi:CRISPR-associated protein Cas2